ARARGTPPLSPILGRRVITIFLSLREDFDIGPGEEWLQRQHPAPETAMMARPASHISPAAARPPGVIHPGWLRVMHWLNALAVVIMVMSGWRIYNAAPFFDFTFPNSITLGGWLGGALQWHFAAMWLLFANGMLYLALNLATGRLWR